MKKKILVCAFIVACLSILAYSTTAYFTYEETATNVIAMGNIRIELQEEENGVAKPFEDATIEVLPGIEVDKVVQVQNVGENAAWIRISVEKSIRLAEGVQGEADLSLIGYDLNTEYWIEQDGYFYYKEALKAGETTQPLFTQVNFAENMDNSYQESIATIKVIAHATQVIHNGDSVLTATGWPKE